MLLILLCMSSSALRALSLSASPCGQIFDKYIKHGATSEIPVNVQTRIEVLGRLFRADIHIYDQASKDAIRCMLPEVSQAAANKRSRG